MTTTTLLVTLVLLLAVAAVVALGVRRLRAPRGEAPLPTEWSLAPRPVFSEHEQRIHRQLREALPQHVILAKLPLVRFCHPTNPAQVRFWFDLLGAIHVSFAVCSASGRVLAAIDLEDGRTAGPARRSTLVKQAVLAACRIRYVRYGPDQTPSVPELQLLVPANPAAAPATAAAHAAAAALPAGVVMRAGFGAPPAARNVDAFRRRTHPGRMADDSGRDSSSFGRDSVIGGFSQSVPTIALPVREGEVIDVPPVRH